MPEIILQLVQEYGLLPPYAVIIALIGLSASNTGQLIASLAILCGVYFVIFKQFDLKVEFGILDITPYLGLPADQGNMVTAALFVFVVGIIAYGLKQVATS